MIQNDEFLIGVLFECSGVNIEMICYYEKIGVMLKFVCSVVGYCIYIIEYVRWLYFVWCGCEFGFSLDELCGLFCLVDGYIYICWEVYVFIIEYLKDICQKIVDLWCLEWVMLNMVV